MWRHICGWEMWWYFVPLIQRRTDYKQIQGQSASCLKFRPGLNRRNEKARTTINSVACMTGIPSIDEEYRVVQCRRYEMPMTEVPNGQFTVNKENPCKDRLPICWSLSMECIDTLPAPMAYQNVIAMIMITRQRGKQLRVFPNIHTLSIAVSLIPAPTHCTSNALQSFYNYTCKRWLRLHPAIFPSWSYSSQHINIDNSSVAVPTQPI
jgi:hypothetical protein